MSTEKSVNKLRGSFITAKMWKQIKCASVGEWLNKLWYIYSMKELTIDTTTEMDLNDIQLSEKKSTLKVKIVCFHLQ